MLEDISCDTTFCWFDSNSHQLPNKILNEIIKHLKILQILLTSLVGIFHMGFSPRVRLLRFIPTPYIIFCLAINQFAFFFFNICTMQLKESQLPGQGLNPGPVAEKVPSPSHWTTREFPLAYLFLICFCIAPVWLLIEILSIQLYSS